MRKELYKSSHYYQGKAEVEIIFSKSLRVRLIEVVYGYEAGESLSIPKLLNLNRWSWNKRLASMEVK